MPRSPEWARFFAPGPVSSQVSTAARSCAGFTRWQGHHTVLMAGFSDHHFVRHRPQTQYRLHSNLRSQHHQAVFKPWVIAAPGCVQTLGHSSPRLCSNLGSQHHQTAPWVTAAPGCVHTLLALFGQSSHWLDNPSAPLCHCDRSHCIILTQPQSALWAVAGSLAS